MIRRNTWITLAAFVIVLSAAVWWTRFKPQSGTSPAGETPTPQALWQVTAQDVVGLRLEDLSAGQVVELKRDATLGWQMVQPKVAPADAARVELAVSGLLEPQPTGELPNPGDLSPFGLAKPLRRVTLFLKDGVSRAFTVGRKSPTGGTIYVQLPGRSDVLLMSDYGLQDALGLLDQPPFLTTPTPTASASPTLTAGATPTPPAGVTASPQASPDATPGGSPTVPPAATATP